MLRLAGKATALGLFLLVAPSSLAATASLSSLLSGGTLTSDNGLLKFSDFKYTPFSNAPAPVNITVKTLDDGLAFGTPLFTFSSLIDFNIEYKVTGIGVLIDSVKMQSTGSGTGAGFAGVFKVVEEDDNDGLANLTNVFGSGITMGTATATFDPQAVLLIRDDVFLNPGSQGTAGISDFKQTFGTTPAAIPTPTAAAAGLALLGVTGIRRRRSA